MSTFRESFRHGSHPKVDALYEEKSRGVLFGGKHNFSNLINFNTF
jgi:hypothetical protein